MIEKKVYYEFLDGLQASGETNMTGASPYVQRRFLVDREEANRMVLDWMATYDERLENNEISDRVLVVETETTMTFRFEDGKE